MIDLFCGYKGASEAMRRRGWIVETADIMKSFQPTYTVDLQDWSFEPTNPDLRIPDLVWASPPCQEFSRQTMPWTRARNPAPPDLSLIKSAQRIIDEIRPRWWVIENVRGAIPYLGKPVKKIGAYCLWGKFPDFEATTSKRKESLPSWKKQERALVPYSISLALALACEAKWNGIIEVAV
jgi:hypothetical protein